MSLPSNFEGTACAFHDHCRYTIIDFDPLVVMAFWLTSSASLLLSKQSWELQYSKLMSSNPMIFYLPPKMLTITRSLCKVADHFLISVCKIWCPSCKSHTELKRGWCPWKRLAQGIPVPRMHLAHYTEITSGGWQHFTLGSKDGVSHFKWVWLASILRVLATTCQ